MGDRSNINLVGNTTQGENVGIGNNNIYKGKSGGNILQFRRLVASGITEITTGSSSIIIYVPPDSITGVTWGSIVGTLSGQTDLQNALNLKLDISTYSGDSFGWSNLANGSTVAGCGTVASGGTIECNTFYGE